MHSLVLAYLYSAFIEANNIFRKLNFMPIIKPTKSTAPVFEPKDDYIIGKYMDTTKFISLLYKQALFFCRVDKLEDKFEGTSVQTNFNERIKGLESLRASGFFSFDMSDEDILKMIKEDEIFEEKQRAINCIDCWNKSENESAALWKIYSDFSKGIMIKSSISRLVKSFEKTQNEIQLSEVEYKLYKKEKLPYGNSNYPFLFKQKAYSYEDEIRLIYGINTEDGSDWKHDWSKEEVEEGIYIKTDLNELISEIVISPYSHQWYFDLILDVTKKYNLDKVVVKSEFSVY